EAWESSGDRKRNRILDRHGPARRPLGFADGSLERGQQPRHVAVVLDLLRPDHDGARALPKDFRRAEESGCPLRIPSLQCEEAERLELIGERAPAPEVLPRADRLAEEGLRLVECATAP